MKMIWRKKLYCFFVLKLRQLVDQGRAARAGGENRGGGDGLEVCRHWISDQGQQRMVAGVWQSSRNCSEREV